MRTAQHWQSDGCFTVSFKYNGPDADRQSAFVSLALLRWRIKDNQEMASLTKTVGKRGTTWRIEFFDANNKRKCIRLGKIDKRQAESIKARGELLVAARITGTSPDVETSRRGAGRGGTVYVGL